MFASNTRRRKRISWEIPTLKEVLLIPLRLDYAGERQIVIELDRRHGDMTWSCKKRVNKAINVALNTLPLVSY